MQQAWCHHVNDLAMQTRSEIQEHMQARDSEVLAMLHSISSLASVSSSDSDTSEMNHNVNRTAEQIHLNVLKLLKELSQEMKLCKPAQQKHFAKKKPDGNNIPLRLATCEHCRTHEDSNQSSAECRRKAQGHRKNATFENKQRGGSTACCS